jgi:hypothetical protein
MAAQGHIEILRMMIAHRQADPLPGTSRPDTARCWWAGAALSIRNDGRDPGLREHEARRILRQPTQPTNMPGGRAP